MRPDLCRARTAPGASSLRSRVAWSATLVVTGWVIALGVGANVILSAALVRAAESSLRARAEAVSATLVIGPSGSVTEQDIPDDRALDTGTWVFDAEGAVVEEPPRAPRDVRRRVAAMVGAGDQVADVGVGDRTRLLALPVEGRDGEQVATVVTSTSLAPYQELERLAVLSSALAALALLAVVHAVLRASLARALAPVREMGDQVERWSADAPARRLGSTARPDELARLATTLDGLLDRIAAAIRHEQMLTAELSHELRTPLSHVRAEVDWLRAAPRESEQVEESLDTVDAAITRMASVVESVMAEARTRTSAPGRSAVADALAPAVQVARGAARTREPEVRITVQVEPMLVVGVDAAVLARAFAPVVENAVRYAATEVTVVARRVDAAVEIVISDDGPGIGRGVAEDVFLPGFRAQPHDGHTGAGLGLALARRLADAAGGSLELLPSASGAAFRLVLPAG